MTDRDRLLKIDSMLQKTQEEVKTLMFRLLDTRRELGEIISGRAGGQASGDGGLVIRLLDPEDGQAGAPERDNCWWKNY
jgi:hypothetical protein